VDTLLYVILSSRFGDVLPDAKQASEWIGYVLSGAANLVYSSFGLVDRRLVARMREFESGGGGVWIGENILPSFFLLPSFDSAYSAYALIATICFSS
jgi:hypothetical protein